MEKEKTQEKEETKKRRKRTNPPALRFCHYSSTTNKSLWTFNDKTGRWLRHPGKPCIYAKKLGGQEDIHSVCLKCGISLCPLHSERSYYISCCDFVPGRRLHSNGFCEHCSSKYSRELYLQSTVNEAKEFYASRFGLPPGVAINGPSWPKNLQSLLACVVIQRAALAIVRWRWHIPEKFRKTEMFYDVDEDQVMTATPLFSLLIKALSEGRVQFLSSLDCVGVPIIGSTVFPCETCSSVVDIRSRRRDDGYEEEEDGEYPPILCPDCEHAYQVISLMERMKTKKNER